MVLRSFSAAAAARYSKRRHQICMRWHESVMDGRENGAPRCCWCCAEGQSYVDASLSTDDVQDVHIAVPVQTATWFTCIAQIPLGSSRHVSTRHVRRVEPMHFVCVELVEQHGSTSSSRRARHVERVVSCRDVTWRAKWKLGLSLYTREQTNISVLLAREYVVSFLTIVEHCHYHT